MKEIGKMISNTEKVSNFGTIIQGTKENTSKERSMVSEATPGKMDLNILVSGKRIKSMETEDIPGTMEENTKVTGRTIIWMVMELTHGKMEENMKDNIHETKNTAKVSTPGQTAENTMVNGRTAVNTVKVNIFQKQDNSEKESGIMVKEKSGLTKMKITNDLTIILFLVH